MGEEGRQEEGSQAEGSQAGGPQAEGSQAGGPQAGGPQAEGSQAEGPQAEGQKAEGPQAEGQKGRAVPKRGARVGGRQERLRRGAGLAVQALGREAGRAPLSALAAMLLLLILGAALLAPWLAPQNPFDPATLSLLDAFLPPLGSAGHDPRYFLGTDDQGRDLLSAILFGLRASLFVGGGAVLLALLIGVSLGLIAGYAGGVVDSVLMRMADIQMTFPAILLALLLDGILRALLPGTIEGEHGSTVLILAIGLSHWVPFARTVRASTLVQARSEYVQAARLIGRSPLAILGAHILPNVAGPVLVLATLTLAIAILSEATLSFLGVGLPPTEPSLGTLIRIGNNYLFSGEWWIALFPGGVLVLLVLTVNILGDSLRDRLNPRLA